MDRNFKFRRRVTLYSLVLLPLLLGLSPTFYSISAQRVYSDTSIHNTSFYPSGYSERGFPVSTGESLQLRFSSPDRSFDILILLGERWGQYRENPDGTVEPFEGTMIIHEQTSVGEGTFTYTIPRTGAFEFLWRPSSPGSATLTYEIKVIPNPAGMSLLPLLTRP